MIATTIQQSQHLLELGLDPATADMYWNWAAMLGNNNNEWVEVKYQDCLFVGRFDGATPAWSLSALLNLIPMVDLYAMPSGGYMCTSFYKNCSHRHFAGTPIEAAYEVVKWLLLNNAIKKGGTK